MWVCRGGREREGCTIVPTIAQTMQEHSYQQSGKQKSALFLRKTTPRRKQKSICNTVTAGGLFSFASHSTMKVQCILFLKLAPMKWWDFSYVKFNTGHLLV